MESKDTEETSSGFLDAEITGIKFGLASRQEIRTASINECPITHSSQLSNPFLGLPLEFGRCESCGTSDLGKCEGHFGYIELPIPVYHPNHVSELKRLLSLICLKCLKMRDNKYPIKGGGIGERLLVSCCEDAAQVSVREVKMSDGTYSLQLKLLTKSRYHDGFWNFMERYGFRYGVDVFRTLLPCEVAEILRKIPKETRKKLAAKGYFPQDGYILHYLPVPPNCLSVPDVSDGVSVMSSDLSISMLKKVLKQVEIIKSSRSGTPNFESHEVEANDLQTAVNQYLEVRGTAKASRDVDTRYGINKETSDSATKAWLEKMRTLFIRKGSGFSSRSVITGDAFKKVNEIGIPFEIAQRITFEERVSIHNIKYLQDLVDKKLCLTYKDGSSTYSLREGSKGYTLLRPGQVVHRRIMDGDIVFINRPPTTHKHSLQALSVYVHEDHTVKINPLICGPLGADFDGDCIHLFYPQSLAAKAEVLELFSVEKQLLSSHSGNLNLQLAADALLSLKMMVKRYFFDKQAAQQLAMHVSAYLPPPTLLKSHPYGSSWTALQMLQTALPVGFDCSGDKYLIRKSDIISVDFTRDIMPSMINEIVTSIFFDKGPQEVLNFFNSLQPLLMENIYSEGFSVSLQDFFVSKQAILDIQRNIEIIAPLLYHVRSTHNELVQLQLEHHIRLAKLPISHFILKLSAFGHLIDSRSDSAINKIIQQIGFLGMQLSNKGKFYSKSLFEDMAALYQYKYPFDQTAYPPGKYGLVKSSFFNGLDPYELMVHSISTREVIVRSTRGLSEPGTLFKNLMAILRDVVICYDGTVRNVCSNSIIQFEYGACPGGKPQPLFPAGEPVGVLAATAMSNPAYKAVLDSSPNSNSSWEQMKEILLCRVNFRNELIDRRVILYLNDCDCGRRHCLENAAYVVQNHLRKISLKDAAVDFMIEYKDQRTILEGSGIHAGLVGHIHLNGVQLKDLNVSMMDVLQRCQEKLHQFRRKKKVGTLFRKTILSVSDGCSFHHLCPRKKSETPCLTFSWTESNDVHLEGTLHILANMICPVLLDTIIKGDPRISSANIMWINPDTSTWIRNHCQNEMGELALEVTLEKSVCKRSGDAWRTVLDCCIPVLHLIDMRRSIPYAIKQVQELLGISCAFDQVVQRLSASVTMVAKGLLKEHLILLADTMTFSGNLIGFNSGGYKALSRSLNVQVPFTEATLFTPRKCFERAAVKCHTDSLSSIVASCSWGKPVSVGTGSKFELLWGTKEVELEHDTATNVYSFLHMVRGTNMEESDTACLGVEVDDLVPENEDADFCHSPENNGGFDKPSFEDSAEFQNISDAQPSKSSWENVTSANNGVSGDDWVSHKSGYAGNDSSKTNSWSSWGKGESVAQDFSTNSQDDLVKSGGWDSSASWDKGNNVNSNRSNVGQSTAWSSWGKDASAVPEKAKDDCSMLGGLNMDDSPWGDKSKDVNTSRYQQSNAWSNWASDKPAEKQDIGSGAGSAGSSWEKRTNKDVNEGRSNMDKSDPWLLRGSDKNTKSNDAGSSGWTPDTSWGKKVNDGNTSNTRSNWGLSDKKAEIKDVNSMGGEDNASEQPWHRTEEPNGWAAMPSGKNNQSGPQFEKSWTNSPKSTDEESKQQSLWGKQRAPSEEKGQLHGSKNWGSNSSNQSGWQKDQDATPELSRKVEGDTFRSSSWGTAASQRRKNNDEETSNSAEPNSWSSWKQDKADKQDIQNSAELNSWSGWKQDKADKQDTQNSAEMNSWSGWKQDKADKQDTQNSAEPNSWSSWIQDKSDRQDTQNSAEPNSWSYSKHDKADKQDTQSDGWNGKGWERMAEDGNKSEKVWSGSQKAEGTTNENQWRQQDSRKRNNFEGSRNRGSNPDWKIKKNHGPKPPEMDLIAPKLFTATRQRLDMFTSEEQDILSEVEPIMKSIRRIMHQSGYNDADPLSAEDQSYIVEHVLNYHPDKAVKMGAGINYITVDRHSSFQDSRCMYVVSIDGNKIDFSYRKCLESFIKGKYPELAEEFIGKYFKRRDGGGRERSVAPDEAGTRETVLTAPEEPGTNTTPEEPGTNTT